MQYGYVKAIKNISVANQVDILISHGVDKEHIYTSPDDIPTKSGDTIIVCKLAVLGMTFGQLYHYFIDLHFRKVKLISVLDTVNTTDQAFMKAFRNLHENEMDVREELGKKAHKKAIALGKSPGMKRVIGAEQEKRIHELLEKGLSYKEIYESIGTTRSTFYLWRKRNNDLNTNVVKTKD